MNTIECPCCGDDSTAPDTDGYYADGQPLACGCNGGVIVDEDDGPYISISDDGCECQLCMCGDWRYEHTGGGICRTCQQHSHKQLFAPCQQFRSCLARVTP